MKILLAGPYPLGTLERFQSMLPEHQITPAKTQEEYDSEGEWDAVVVRVLKTPEKTLQNKKGLKALIRWGAGYDSVDIEAAGARGILVANTPGVNSYAVSELAVALMLSVGRCITEQDRLTRQGTWNNKLYADQMVTLNHKTVGIIGGGNIGRRTAMQVQAFGATVIYYDVFRLSVEMEQNFGMTFVSLEALLKNSDVISLHVPLTEGSRHMIGKDEIAMMKDHAILINTARGGLIDDAALKEALEAGRLGGAGLDCVENEDMSVNPLTSFDRVVITPHMGGTSNDLPEEMVPVIVGQLKQFSENGNLDFVVNKEFLK